MALTGITTILVKENKRGSSYDSSLFFLHAYYFCLLITNGDVKTIGRVILLAFVGDGAFGIETSLLKSETNSCLDQKKQAGSYYCNHRMIIACGNVLIEKPVEGVPSN